VFESEFKMTVKSDQTGRGSELGRHGIACDKSVLKRVWYGIHCQMSCGIQQLLTEHIRIRRVTKTRLFTGQDELRVFCVIAIYKSTLRHLLTYNENCSTLRQNSLFHLTYTFS